jgi:hypothetical protein
LKKIYFLVPPELGARGRLTLDLDMVALVLLC